MVIPKSTISMREWRKNNPDKYKEAIKRQCQQRTKRSRQEYHLQRTYGISIQDKLQMMENQQNSCQICKKEFKTFKHAHVDHCHTTGRIRGILCSNCNGKLGWYEMLTKIFRIIYAY